MTRPWRVLEQDPRKVADLADSFGLSPLLAKCLLNRDIPNYQEIDSFLKPTSYHPPDPFLMPDMKKAIARIAEALDQGERICIYGDYDADGITAIAILTQALRELQADVFYYIPDRFFEGVGLHSERLRKLKEEETVGLVITVDTGIRAFEEMAFAREIGLDVIITDHHTPDQNRPDALAVLNPKLPGSTYPFKYLCGAGVAFKLVQALSIQFPNRIDERKYLKIAAIGTIADMVPLRKENRWLVAHGLAEISREEHGPLRQLVRKLGIKGEINALDISFKVAPRINAPGRLGDPDLAISFFQYEGQVRDSVRKIEQMEGMNHIRQLLERELEQKIEQQLRHSYKREIPPFLLVAGKHWHRGILGIMACKLLRRFGRTACILSFDDKTAHGSIRGLPGLDVLPPLHEISSLLSSYGGHPEAAGVSMPVTNISQFKARMNELLAPYVQDMRQSCKVSVDAEVSWRELGEKFFATISKMAPFGIGNNPPVFLSPNLILESEPVRKGPWYHFEASDGFVSRRCSYYHPFDLKYSFERYDSIDLIFSLTPFREEYQVQVVEMRPSET